jgi:hypothetical protein
LPNTVPVKIGAYADAWLRDKPKPHTEKQREQARKLAVKAAWAVLHDDIKVKVTQLQLGMLGDAETLFLPHIMTPSGQRVIEVVKAGKAAGLLPAPEQESAE